MNDSSTGTRQASMLHVAIALGAVYFIWGSTYLAIRFAIETIPPFLMASCRYLTAGTLALRLVPTARDAAADAPPLAFGADPRRLSAARRQRWRGVGGAACRLRPHGAADLHRAVVDRDPRLAAHGRKRPDWRVLAGLILGFVGLMLLVRRARGASISSLRWRCWRRRCAGPGLDVWPAGAAPASPLLTTGMEMLCGGALLLVASTLTGEPSRFALSAVSAKSLLALGYLIVFGAIVAFTCYVWLLRVAPPVLVSTYAYVNPWWPSLLGWFFAGEPLTGRTALAAAVILTGVALISLAQSSARAWRKSGSARSWPERRRSEWRSRWRLKKKCARCSKTRVWSSSTLKIGSGAPRFQGRHFS